MKRVKRDLVDKRQEARAYRNVRYTDQKWDKQWYLVSITWPCGEHLAAILANNSGNDVSNDVSDNAMKSHQWGD